MSPKIGASKIDILSFGHKVGGKLPTLAIA
jgi:hypothetical protein